MTLLELDRLIEGKTVQLAVIGLGYVGLPVACSFAQRGFAVLGLDLDQVRVDKINAGICPLEGIEPDLPDLVAEVVGTGKLRATSELSAVAKAQVVLIAVQTPVEDETRKPLYRALSAALENLGKVMRPGTLVIVESTLAPGTMDGLVVPLLETSSGLMAGVDFWVGHCPERVMPGKLLHNIAACDRVVGGMTPEVAETMVALYRHIVRGDLDPTDPLTAELVKTGENTYRDVNIAFANEMALVCEALGGDVFRVRDLLNKSPGRNMLLPGAGVGGHCIPKDPWLLIANAGPLRLIPAAREVNDSMPRHVFDLLADGLAEANLAVSDSRVAVLGYAYLENSDDTRNAPSISLVQLLRQAGATVVVHDPFVEPFALHGGWATAVKGADAAVLMVAHDAYRDIPLDTLKSSLRSPVLVDGRHLFDAQQAIRTGLIFRGIGVGHRLSDRRPAAAGRPEVDVVESTC